ncbi:hypothetical protein MIMGU_mgv1a0010611mg, partial [Erythranthe guttata]
MKKHEKDSGNSSASNQAKPSTPEKSPAVAPRPGKMKKFKNYLAEGKTSKYFATDGPGVKDDVDVEEAPAKKTAKELVSNVKPPTGKSTLKLENDDDDDDLTPTSRK